jgi:aminoglycoside phosphotransferase (APT) family kinase protein
MNQSPQNTITPPPAADLVRWLDTRPELRERLGVRGAPRIRFLAHGAANAAYRLETDGAPVVLRVGMVASTRADLRAQVRAEAAVLRFVHDLHISPHLLDLDEDNALGRPILTLEHLDGAPLSYTPEQLDRAGELHARLHSVADTAALSDHVKTHVDPVRDYIAEARPWFEVYRRWSGAQDHVIAAFDAAFTRVAALARPITAPRLIHGDGTFENFRATQRALKIFDWEWCRVTEPMCDPGHLLSPITTYRCDDRLLSRAEEEIYARAYARTHGELGVDAFFHRLNRVRPAVVLHSAAWTAAWLANMSGAPSAPRSDADGLALARMARQLEPTFLDYLTDGGYW